MPPSPASPVPQKIAVTGATGFVGRRLVETLLARGHPVVALSRSARSESADQKPRLSWKAYDPTDAASIRAAIDGCDAVVHLAGDSISEGRWTAAKLARIRESREAATASLVKGIGECAARPRTLVSASAVGYYGPRAAEEELDESAPPGSDFLAGVCRAWEREALGAEAAGARVVIARFGIVLGKGGGALAKMTTPFKLFVGGPIGSGRQAMSWIHLDDLCSMLATMVEDPAWKGPANATAPGAVTNREFAKALGKALHRPSFLPTPGWALRIALGKVAAILTTGQRVVPRAALARGFRFRFTTLEAALADLIGGGGAPA